MFVFNWLEGSVHENVMFSPDAVRSSERFTRAAPSTSGRAKSKCLSVSGGGELCLFAPCALGKFAGFLSAAQQAVGTDVAIKLRPIN